MPCYHPIDAAKAPDGTIVFSKFERFPYVSKLRLPCGQCVGCRLDRARQWATRIMHETTLHQKNSFITLTYDDNNLPGSTPGIGTLQHADFQKFFKRLRRRLEYHTGTSSNLRYYMAGEYGTTFGRPHFHAILFGYDFPDKELWKRTPSNSLIYRSKELESLWPFGYSSIGDVTFESASYVARYVMKKITGDDADWHYSYTELETGEIHQLEPEYAQMSRRPGIGKGWLEKYHSDVYPHDFVEIRGKLAPPPKYYDKIIQTMTNKYEWDEILDKRQKRAKLNPADKTRERLLVKEKVQKAKLQKLYKHL